MFMNRMSSPVTPPVTLSYETPAQPTPSIMNELEDAIITDLQVSTVLRLIHFTLVGHISCPIINLNLFKSRSMICN